MKKKLAIVLAVLFSIAIVGCGSDSGKTSGVSQSGSMAASTTASAAASSIEQSNANEASKPSSNANTDIKIEGGSCPYIGKKFETNDGQYTFVMTADKKCVVNGKEYKCVEDGGSKSDTDATAIRVINGADRMVLMIDAGGKTATFIPTKEVGNHDIPARRVD